MARNAALTTSYAQVWAGTYEAYAVCTAAWRLADKAAPGATEYALIPANVVVPLPMGKPSFVRSESGTPTLQIVE